MIFLYNIKFIILIYILNVYYNNLYLIIFNNLALGLTSNKCINFKITLI